MREDDRVGLFGGEASFDERAGKIGEETPSPRIRRRAASRPGLATPESPGTFARAVCRRRRRERAKGDARAARGEEAEASTCRRGDPER